jgi:ubiquinone/menaquinone biosynthesis C-methylase UbiE
MIRLVKAVARHLRNGTLGSRVMLTIRQRMLGPGLPIGDDYFGCKADIYDSHRENDRYWIAEHKAVGELLERLPEVRSVLDAPFGTGRFLPLYHPKNLEVFGLDSSADMIAQARTKHPEAMVASDVRVGDILSLPYGDGSFDLVVCFRFLPWIVSFAEAEVALGEISRVTRDYAVLELCVGKHETGAGKPKADLTLWNRLNREELSDWIGAHGLRVVDVLPLHDDEEHPGLSAFLCEKLGGGEQVGNRSV